jgi:phytoene synthase
VSVTVATNAWQGEAWRRQLEASRTHCRELSKARAKNFYYGMKLVPEPKRSAMDALYAWMREADDLADEQGEVAAKEAAIAEFLRTTERAVDRSLTDPSQLPAGPIWASVRDMVVRYDMPLEYLRDMIAGQLLDQHKTRYRNFEELYDYCYKVASVVGLACLQIWGYDGGAETRKLAEWRGIAFQLTNILRDVKEDAERDRIYLPAEYFGAFDLNPVMFTLGKPADLAPGLRRTADVAADYYKKSALLDKLVHADGRPCLWAMTAIYHGLLKKIAPDPLIVLRKRVRLSGFHKASIALRATVFK